MDSSGTGGVIGVGYGGVFFFFFFFLPPAPRAPVFGGKKKIFFLKLPLLDNFIKSTMKKN